MGRTLGSDALASVGSIGSLQFLVFGFCSGLAGGVTVDISVYWRWENGKCETFHSSDLYDLGGGFPALYRGRYCLPARAFAYFEYAGKSVSACVCLSAGLLYRTWRTAFIQRGIKP